MKTYQFWTVIFYLHTIVISNLYRRDENIDIASLMICIVFLAFACITFFMEEEKK